MPKKTNPSGGREGGFSLIEVIVALALLAAVLLTISGLFIQGGQSVNTGRDLTEATSLATSVLEEMDKWAFTQLYTNFCVAGTATSMSPFDSRSTSCSTMTTLGAASRWQTEISKRLPNAYAEVTATPMGASGVTFATAKGIRVQVTIKWQLRLMPRQVSLETVRF